MQNIHNEIMYDSLWYDSLIKPVIQPPAWIFTPVWVILYGMLFAALILYAVTVTSEKKMNGYVYFIVHMIFNLLWSPVFFYLHKIDIALVIILIMIFTAVLMIIRFFRVSKLAGFFLLPYFLWLIFAFYLNFEFLILNR